MSTKDLIIPQEMSEEPSGLPKLTRYELTYETLMFMLKKLDSTLEKGTVGQVVVDHKTNSIQVDVCDSNNGEIYNPQWVSHKVVKCIYPGKFDEEESHQE